MVWTGAAPAQRFRNDLRNLTINADRGNVVAIGTQNIANDYGAIRQMFIISGVGTGPIGLDLGYTG